MFARKSYYMVTYPDILISKGKLTFWKCESYRQHAADNILEYAMKIQTVSICSEVHTSPVKQSKG
jgi:hypothetical protein